MGEMTLFGGNNPLVNSDLFKALQEIAAEQGTDAFGRLEQIAMEAAYVKELAQKYEIPETAIRMTTQQLPANPSMAAALGTEVTQQYCLSAIGMNCFAQ